MKTVYNINLMIEAEVMIKMSRTHILEGTWEELKLHEKELAGKRFRLVPVLPEPARAASGAGRAKGGAVKSGSQPLRHLSGMGKFAGLIPSSQEFIREKQEEIELEERKIRG
jgi:hypothetical protein